MTKIHMNEWTIATNESAAKSVDAMSESVIYADHEHADKCYVFPSNKCQFTFLHQDEITGYHDMIKALTCRFDREERDAKLVRQTSWLVEDTEEELGNRIELNYKAVWSGESSHLRELDKLWHQKGDYISRLGHAFAQLQKTTTEIDAVQSAKLEVSLLPFMDGQRRNEIAYRWGSGEDLPTLKAARDCSCAHIDMYKDGDYWEGEHYRLIGWLDKESQWNRVTGFTPKPEPTI